MLFKWLISQICATSRFESKIAQQSRYLDSQSLSKHHRDMMEAIVKCQYDVSSRIFCFPLPSCICIHRSTKTLQFLNDHVFQITGIIISNSSSSSSIRSRLYNKPSRGEKAQLFINSVSEISISRKIFPFEISRILHSSPTIFLQLRPGIERFSRSRLRHDIAFNKLREMLQISRWNPRSKNQQLHSESVDSKQNLS